MGWLNDPVFLRGWQRADLLLQQALKLAPEQRSEFLRTQCGDDAELRAAIQNRLAAAMHTHSTVLERSQ
jgi:hypothetical protein